MEEAFRIKLKEDRNSVNLNSVCFSKQKYEEVIKKVIHAKSKMKNKLPADYNILKKYNVLESDGIKRLIAAPKESESNIVYYVHDDEIFQILLDTHLSLDHGGRDKMMKELKKSYKNVTYKDIMLFLNLCKRCRKKYTREEKDIEKSASNKLNSKSQINLIDYRSHPDGEYKFVLIYQELSTKFCFLKPLTSNEIKEIEYNLTDVFTLLGPPAILQIDEEHHFVKSLIDVLKIRWNKMQIISVKSEKEPLERIDQEIDNMIRTWMRDNATSRWSDGLRFIQLKKNTTFHPAVNKSPYDALFKRPLNFGSTSKKVNEIDPVQENITEPEIICKVEPSDGEYEKEYDSDNEISAVIKEEMNEITTEYKLEEDNHGCDSTYL